MRASKPETFHSYVFSSQANAAFFVGPSNRGANKMLLTAKAMREQAEELRGEVDAIVAVATDEQRELSEDEQTRVNAIIDNELPKLEEKIQQREKIEAVIKDRAAAKLTPEIDRQEADADEASGQFVNRLASVKVPAKAKARKPLEAFDRTEDGERQAFVAGQFFLANCYGNPYASQWCRNHGVHVRGAMTTGDNSLGGFLVPDELQNTLIRLRETRGVFPQFARRVPMGSDIINVPRLLSDVTAYWVGENAEITASDANLGSVELMAKKLGSLTRYSTELDEDAIVDIGDMVVDSMAYAMADKVDDAAFNGDGTSTYGGVLGLKNALNANAIVNAATGNDAANNLDLLDFENVVGAFPEYPGASPRWFMSKPVFMASAARLANAAGGTTSEQIGGGPPMAVFMGYPVTFTQVMTKTTTTQASTIVAYFGDLSLGATYGVRRGMRIEASRERYFEYDQLALRTTERLAINIHERGDTIRTRPIIALKTAA